MTLPAPLEPLRAYHQWIIYRLEPQADGKTAKRPVHHASGTVCSLMDPANHTDYGTAAAAVLAGRGHGVGFVFTPDDPFWFLDIDSALIDGQWSPLATDLYQQLYGAAWEVSQSGTGLHAIGTGPLPPHGTRNQALGLELYHEARFIALTLQCYPDGSADAVLPVIVDIAAAYFPPLAAGDALDGWTTEPVAEWSGPADDDELLRMALASRSAAASFTSPGGAPAKASFADLWVGETHGLGPSEADAALASHLAFWTGKDCARIETLMRQSALARDKWDRASAYLEPTILRACATVRSVLQVAPAPPVPPDAAKALETGEQYGAYVPPAQYASYFAGCAYVMASNQIYTPSHGLTGSTGFDTAYGGRMFVLDGEGRKVTSSAWEAFRVNQQWRPPIADDTCFRPELAPGALVVYEGRSLVNSYVPIVTRSLVGDAAPFLDFLARILPDERDRSILTTYMAAVVQNPGRKFQWWPVLQGVEGNGKTTLLRVMSHAVGHRYTHLVNPEAMAKTGGQFNSWVQGNLFCGIEEIYVAKRREFLETFKATVTNDRLAMEGKGTAQFTGDNRCNGMMLTNYHEGVPITTDTRRYAILYTAQQCEADLARDGMAGDYFPRLYDWLKADGYAIVNSYLRAYVPVAEFNPAGDCQRAPKTSSHLAALLWSLGTAEQHVIEAIEEGQPGFRGGWVSSHYLSLLLERIQAKVPLNKRGTLMRSIGYDIHPLLADSNGRVDGPVNPDGKKCRLYIKDGHISLNITKRSQVGDAYSAAQISPERANLL